jgi:hypothetical protein
VRDKEVLYLVKNPFNALNEIKLFVLLGDIFHLEFSQQHLLSLPQQLSHSLELTLDLFGFQMEFCGWNVGWD